MANEQNLVSISERSTEEAREISKRGGINSGKSRKAKKKLKTQLENILSMPIPDELQSMLSEKGMQGVEDSDMCDALCFMIYLHSLNGNTKMLEILLKLIGEHPDAKRSDKELNFRIKTTKEKSEQSLASSQPPEINIVVSAATPADMEDDEDDSEAV